jgi:hypothetical protein
VLVSSETCSLPRNSVAYPIVLPAGAGPVTVFDAAPGTGAGQCVVVLTVEETVAANAYRGVYSSTWTFSMSGGP